MNIGLYFGSFDPIHYGHRAIAGYFLQRTPLDEIWFVITPQNPLKNKVLTSNEHRLNMVECAVEEHPFLKASDVEFTLSEPYHTYTTLQKLKADFPIHNFSLIIGQDNLAQFHKWYAYEAILNEFLVCVYPRSASEKKALDWLTHPKMHFVSAPLIEISSTAIRAVLKNKRVLNEKVLAPKVMEYIQEHGLYG